MSALNKLMGGYNPHKALIEQTKGLVSKWNPTGLLEGLDTEQELHGMAVLLENQARELIDESSRAGTSAGSEEWSGVALPLVRRIFGEIAAKDFVSVQPMNLPSGLVFYLNFKYGSSNQPGFTEDSNIHGTTETAGDPSGGLYGAGRFGYSINDTVTSDLHASASNTAGALSASVADATWADVNYDADISASIVAGKVHKVTFLTSSLSNPDLNGVRAFEVAGTGIVNDFPAHAGTSGANIFFFVSSSGTVFEASNDVNDVTVRYHKQPTDITRGDFEAGDTQDFAKGSGDSYGADVGIPEVDVAMESKPIVAKTRKLKAVWTPELAQDLNAYHSVDAEAELTSMLSEYISMEIDLEILDMLIQNALTTEHWSARIGYERDSTVTDGFSQVSSAAGYAYTKNEWFQTLGNKIQRVSNKIHQKTMRGGANFLVAGPDVCTIIESMQGWNAGTDGTAQSFAMGVQQTGTLNNRFTVYKNPYILDNTILVGFRGSNFLETGAVYAPYIPLIMTPLIYDPVNFTPRKGVMTRYAKKMIRSEFYGKIIVDGLEYV